MLLQELSAAAEVGFALGAPWAPVMVVPNRRSKKSIRYMRPLPISSVHRRGRSREARAANILDRSLASTSRISGSHTREITRVLGCPASTTGESLAVDAARNHHSSDQYLAQGLLLIRYVALECRGEGVEMFQGVRLKDGDLTCDRVLGLLDVDSARHAYCSFLVRPARCRP